MFFKENRIILELLLKLSLMKYKEESKMTHNNQKKIAVINDFSGFGRCSITVSLPIISAMKIQCCPVPTAVFSNHTGFETFFFDDYTARMDAYIEQWEKLNLKFEGICTGFLGSVDQIAIVERFLKRFKTGRTLAIIDPVMGDYGKLYATYTDKLANEMKKLTGYADILTPNLTEICILTDTPYCEKYDAHILEKMCRQLSEQGPEKIVVSGIVIGEHVGNFIYERGKSPTLLKSRLIGENRSGTGDVFSSIIAADAVNGVDFTTSVKKASDFISKAILYTMEKDIPVTDGICFEEFLTELS